MRRTDPHAQIDATQQGAADAGLKGMISFGRPFFEYIISSLADAGISDVCLIIGPEHDAIRDYFATLELTRVRIHFAVQEKPLGTADAVLAGERFADGEIVLVVNSDNLYPVHTLRGLQQLERSGVAAFEREALIHLSNIDPERVARYSVIAVDENGFLRTIIEKPDPAHVADMNEILVGMNSWSLSPEVYDACRRIEPSARGELELPTAVQYAIDVMRVPFRVLVFHDGVLDLSNRADIAAVAKRLEGVEPHL